jgi:hypothetical protein
MADGLAESQWFNLVRKSYDHKSLVHREIDSAGSMNHGARGALSAALSLNVHSPIIEFAPIDYWPAQFFNRRTGKSGVRLRVPLHWGAHAVSQIDNHSDSAGTSFIHEGSKIAQIGMNPQIIGDVVSIVPSSRDSSIFLRGPLSHCT